MTTLTMKDEKRLDVIQRVYRSELTVVEASRTDLGHQRTALLPGQSAGEQGDMGSLLHPDFPAFSFVHPARALLHSTPTPLRFQSESPPGRIPASNFNSFGRGTETSLQTFWMLISSVGVSQSLFEWPSIRLCFFDNTRKVSCTQLYPGEGDVHKLPAPLSAYASVAVLKLGFLTAACHLLRGFNLLGGHF